MSPLRAVRGIAISFAFTAALAFAADKAPTIADADCEKLGRDIAEHISDGDAPHVIVLLDKFALADRISAGLGFSTDEERNFRTGLLESIPKGLTQQLQNFTSAHFLRVQDVGGEKRALVRFVSEAGAANYMAFVCVRRGSGPVRWADAFIYLAGDTISQAARRSALPMVAESKKGLLERLTGAESQYVANFPKIAKASQHVARGAMKEAWAEMEKLPAALKTDRNVLMLRLRAAQAIDEAKYLGVIQDWEKAYPNDPTLDFISIDGDILRKDYAKAVAHIDSFLKQIGGDAYMDFIAANVLVMAERYDDARKRARAALKSEPTLTSPYDTLLAIGVKTKNHREIIGVLDELVRAYPKMDVGSIVEGEDYAEFRQSEAFQEWSAQSKAGTAKEK